MKVYARCRATRSSRSTTTCQYGRTAAAALASSTLAAQCGIRLRGCQTRRHHPPRVARWRRDKGSGCKYCDQTGYKDRTGIFEILTLNENSRELIIQKSSSEKIQQLSIEEGMKSMLVDGIEKIKQGITTVDEIARVLDV